jgi:hypothetical protein
LTDPKVCSIFNAYLVNFLLCGVQSGEKHHDGNIAMGGGIGHIAVGIEAGSLAVGGSIAAGFMAFGGAVVVGGGLILVSYAIRQY